MTKSRMGKNALDILAPTDAPVLDTPPVASVPRIGRPPNEERASKVTVMLHDRQVVQLDRLATDIRASTGAVVQRAQIIRALVDAILQSDLGLRDVHDEEGIKSIVAKRLNAGRD
jgi:hypothetical protein